MGEKSRNGVRCDVLEVMDGVAETPACGAAVAAGKG